MRRIDPSEIKENAINLIAKRWMLITAGDIDKYNMMTANWGAMGELWFKPVAFVFVRPQRYTNEFVATTDIMTLSFFDQKHRGVLQICGSKSGREIDKMNQPGLTAYKTPQGGVSFREASLVLECRKIYVDTLRKEGFLDTTIMDKCYPNGDFHCVYVVEIENAWVAK